MKNDVGGSEKLRLEIKDWRHREQAFVGTHKGTCHM